MSGRGRGRGRGGGQGRGRGGGNQGPSNAEAATLDAINQAAREIKQILQQMPVSSPSAGGNNRNKSARGSNSMMDLSGGQGRGPPSSGRGKGGGGGGRGGGSGGRGGGSGGRGGGAGGQQWPCNEAPPSYYPTNAPYPNKPVYKQGNQQHYYPGQNQPPNYHHQNPQPNYSFQMKQGPDHQNWGPRSPPPSYDESMSNIAYLPSAPPCPKPRPFMQNIPSQHHLGKKHNQPNATPQKVQDIVKTLARFDGQWATADMLAKQVEESEEEVVATVESRQDIFSYMRDGRNVRVELVPNIRLCSEYLSENGCYAKGSCTRLHLCKNYIMDHCNISACQFGHKFDTDHNTSVLSKLYLDLIERKVLFSIIRKVCKGNAAPQLCSFYNTPNGCRKKEKCDHLHVCRDFVMSGGKCSNVKCPYDHHFNSKQCRTLLSQHGISVNETQRDILLTLKASMPDLESQSSGGGKDSRKDSSSGEKDSKAKGEEVSTKQKNNTETRSGTVRSTDVHGDVEIPEICVFGINNKCYNEKKGCKYLHAKSMFHWQVQKKKKWYNLRIYQSKCLENAYRDVSAEEASIPPLDPNRVEGQNKIILDVLGTNMWTADLNKMVIKNTSSQRLNIRRVSTASAAVSKIPQATVYGWFFKDEQGNWIQYGHIDSLGKQQHVCNITSNDIEKQYMQDPSTPMTISSAQFKYQLDFKQMTQTNLSTGKVREVRRRPTRLSYQQAAASGGGEGSLPSHWLPMRSDQTHLLVKVDSGSQEYLDVVKSVRLTLPTATILSIQRLQNQYLWHLMQYKKADLVSSYNTQDMNIQKLFHGTSSDLVDGICKENIDFRKSHNKNNPYGKGTYFSNSCAIARTQGTPDTSGRSIVVLTEVIIGAVTQGASSFSRPPSNPVTGNPFDTTVDDLQAPTIFVKYDKEEYYPEYMIEFY